MPIMSEEQILAKAIKHFNLPSAVTEESVRNTLLYRGGTTLAEGLFKQVHATLANALFNLDTETQSFEGVFSWVKVVPNHTNWLYYTFEDEEDYEMYVQSRTSFVSKLDEDQLRYLNFFESNLIDELVHKRINVS